MKQTMVGVGAPAPPAPPPPPFDPGLGDDPFANLPAPAAKPAAPAFRAPRPGPPPAPPPPAAPALGAIDELMDLPAIPDETGLPAVVPRAPPRPGFQGAPPPRPQPPSLADFEIDLPSVDADLPAAKALGRPAGKGGMTFDVDLPSPAADLPSAKGGGRGGHADLPAVASGLPVVAAGLPAVSKGFSSTKTRQGFGEIDLPSVGGNLPAVQSREQNLPQVSGGVGLPLPVVGSGLPVVAGVGLPKAIRGDRDLPDLANALPDVANALPQVAGSLPVVVGNERLLPSGRPDPSADQDFGELKLTSMPPISMDDAVEEMDLPPPSRDPQQQISRATGGAGFGEVDLGGGDVGADVVATEEAPRKEQDKVGGGEVALPTGPASRTSRDEDEEEAKPSRSRKIALILVAVIVVGGVLLELTPYGAFGRVAIDDLVHEGSWSRAADDAAKQARTAMAADTADQARAALDELANLHAGSPRAKPLTAYAALAELEAQLRFGKEGARAARAQSWLGDLSAAKGAKPADIHYFTVAGAALSAYNGDFASARAALDTASKKDVGDPIQQDIAFTRGELELAAGDAAAATAAFTKAVQLAPSARAHFGLARAYALAEDVVKAQNEIGAALATSPHDAGALVLRAALVWASEKNESSAMTDLKEVFEGSAKSAASSGDLSRARSLLGWIQASRGKASEARDSFDQALKLDPRSVDALVGQGEVLYSEGRNTEALARFDTAVQIDPKNVRAIVSDAKAKIVLERLADAKTQLTAARTAFPTDMRIAFWLAKVETALGNKKAAEDAYAIAIGLANPAKPEAIEPYVGLAEMLASDGRATEAQAKLDEAKAKLPDSAAMQRALGEVSAVQGNYDDAILHYQAAVQKDPEDLSARFLLGKTYLQMNRIDLASAELDKVLAADKDYPGLAMERGRLFELSGQIEKALEQFSAALKKAPDDVDLQLRVGAAYVGIGKSDEALGILKKVMEKRPQSAEANYYYGRAYFLRGGAALADATRYLKNAVRLDPNHADYHFYLAWVANEASPPDLATARMEIEQALTLNKLMGGAYWQRGVVEVTTHAVDDAIKDLQKALQLEPTRFEVHATLGECYDAKNDSARAMSEWAKALAGDPPRPFWNFRYGKLVLEKGNAGEASKHLGVAVDAAEKQTPQPGWLTQAEFLAAEAYRKTGKKADAVDHFNHFLDLAQPTDPDRRDALSALAGLGHPRER
jgi:tetratricopeptide (TPR) repeat protein